MKNKASFAKITFFCVEGRLMPDIWHLSFMCKILISTGTVGFNRDINMTRFQEFTFWNSAGATSCSPKIVNSVMMDFGVCISLNGRDAKF